ncbi:hypothetical protein ACFPIF_02460 [Brevundimonas faecalis]|uniref:hypothetical protein n=1 Tax=Brevundimonas faecalis TaxID=947378 RepID=UPI00360BE36E
MRQRQTDFERLAWAIHQNAALCLSDPRKFPTFEKFIRPSKPKPAGPASPDRMLSIAQMWTAVVNRGLDDEGGQAEPEA